MPSYEQGPSHFFQYSSVRCSASKGSTGSGAGRWEGCQVRTKGTRSPAETVKSAVWASPCAVGVTGVDSHTDSGPAMPVNCPRTRCIQGTTLPYSKRSRRSMCSSTVPDRPSTMRTTQGAPARRGMKSTTVARPVAVSHSVSRTRESPR